MHDPYLHRLDDREEIFQATTWLDDECGTHHVFIWHAWECLDSLQVLPLVDVIWLASKVPILLFQKFNKIQFPKQALI